MIRRVRGRANFRALAGARRHRAGPVTIRCAAGDPSEPPSVAFAIGRTVGSAVVRNRIRRRIRAIVQARRELLVPGCSYLLGVATEAVSMNPVELDRVVTRALRRAAEAS